MRTTPIDLFLAEPDITIFESVKSVTLALFECKRTQVDHAMPLHVARCSAHLARAFDCFEDFRWHCGDLVRELIRSLLVEVRDQGGYQTRFVFHCYQLWYINLGDEMLVCFDRNRDSLGFHAKRFPESADLQSLREVIISNVFERWRKSTGDHRFMIEFGDRLRERLGDDGLLWLPEAFLTRMTPVPAEKFGDWLAAPVVDLEAKRAACCAAEAKVLERIATTKRAERKREQAIARFMAPVNNFMEGTPVVFRSNLLRWMLSRATQLMGEAYRPEWLPFKGNELPPGYDSLGVEIAIQGLFQKEEHDWWAFADGVLALVLQPRAFTRWNCPPEHKGVKTVLRGFVELVAGPVTLPIERAYLITRLHAPDVTREEVLSLCSQYFGLLCWQKKMPVQLQTQLDPVVAEWTKDLVGWFSRVKINPRKFRLLHREDVEYLQLLKEETAAANAQAEEMARWKESLNRYQCEIDNDDAAADEAVAARVEELRVTYVENLGSEAWRTHAIHGARQDFATNLDLYLTGRDIDTVVPVPSIARAIEHFIYEMEPEQRALVPMERIAGEPWRKLKRGAQRIYVLEKDGEVFVHLMKRKDWAVASMQEARF